jgi:hypothetical protein
MQLLDQPRTAQLAALDADGSVWLHGPDGPRAARVLSTVARHELARALATGLPVLITGEPPIILGVVLGQAEERAELRLVDGAAVLDAARGVVLRCGAAAIRIAADGTVRLEGTDVRSHARRLQRITGAQVRIN